MAVEQACIVQKDFTILVETDHSLFEEARQNISSFADLVKAGPPFHTYKMTSLSLWNAASAGMSSEQIIHRLHSISRFSVPIALIQTIQKTVDRYGKLSLQWQKNKACLCLKSTDAKLLQQLITKHIQALFQLQRVDEFSFLVPIEQRGVLKQELTRLGYPVIDLAGYKKGKPLSIKWRMPTQQVQQFDRLRKYQRDAVQSFEGCEGMGGSGVIVLPCGAGKTVIGIAVMERLQCETLILTSNTTSVKQWIHEIGVMTSVGSECVGEYSGQKKEVRPITVATYQILTHKKNKSGKLEHLKLLNEREWGLIIYDEVHCLPAPVFRATADIQATQRLGLTATLIREDGCEEDVFSLIGPKRYDMPWKDLERQGWIAKVKCYEVRVPFTSSMLRKYKSYRPRQQFRFASENIDKIKVVQQLLRFHKGLPAIIIGQYIDQLNAIGRAISAPVLCGSMSQKQRMGWFDAFRNGEINTIVVSKIANFAVDLPDATLAIEVSGSFGSRQEEAQRLGRVLRPKPGQNVAFFYTIVTENTCEQKFALKRQLFLLDQGYEYTIDPNCALTVSDKVPKEDFVSCRLR